MGRRIFKGHPMISRVGWGLGLAGRQIRRHQNSGQLEANLCCRSGWRRCQEKPLGTTQHVRTKTDTGRRGEYPQALERTVVKELGKLTP